MNLTQYGQQKLLAAGIKLKCAQRASEVISRAETTQQIDAAIALLIKTKGKWFHARAKSFSRPKRDHQVTDNRL